MPGVPNNHPLPSCDQNCLQTLRKVHLGSKSPPDENHCPWPRLTADWYNSSLHFPWAACHWCPTFFSDLNCRTWSFFGHTSILAPWNWLNLDFVFQHTKYPSLLCIIYAFCEYTFWVFYPSGWWILSKAGLGQEPAIDFPSDSHHHCIITLYRFSQSAFFCCCLSENFLF